MEPVGVVREMIGAAERVFLAAIRAADDDKQ
jgi:hypothetical protein